MTRPEDRRFDTVKILYRLKTDCDREIEKIFQPLKIVNTLFHEFFRHKLKFRDVVVRTGSYSIECCSKFGDRCVGAT